jgi:hypothetical protein
MREVTLHPDYYSPGNGVYAATTPEGGTATLSFDATMDTIDRYSTELLVPAPEVQRGTMEAFAMLEVLRDALVLRHEVTGEQAVSDLSPDLIGLEGRRVTVLDDEDSEPRSFVVGKTDGPLPRHLEDGGPARRHDYFRVWEP